ncbi:MAG: DUF1559 domain-containing protein [Planctomycetaceae bacterium]
MSTRLVTLVLAVLTLCAGNVQAQQAQVRALALQPATRKSEFLQYVPNDTLVVAAGQPGRLLHSAGMRELMKNAEAEDVEKKIFEFFTKETGVNYDTLEEIGVVVTETYLEAQIKETRDRRNEARRLSSLRQMGLAFHNYHDTYNRFPGANSDNENDAKLSWRVHLLPYLEQAELYQQFHLDEPWDSEHNKTLIEKMPDIFKTEGVKDAGKTSLHVLTGDNMPFGQEEARRIRDVTDGTSNTLMVVEAGADKASEWTKPEELKFNGDDPKATFGKVGSLLPVLLMDGSTQLLSMDLDADVLKALATHAGGEVISDDFRSRANYYGPQPPGFVLTFSAPVDNEQFVEKLTHQPSNLIEIAGVPAREVSPAVFAFPNERTILFGQRAIIEQMLKHEPATGEIRKRFEELYPANDGVAVADAKMLVEFFIEENRGVPMFGMVESIEGGEAVLDFTGTSPNVISLHVKTANALTAAQLIGLAQSGLGMVRSELFVLAQEETSGITSDHEAFVTTMLDSAKIEAQKGTAVFEMEKPQDAAEFRKLLQPLLKDFASGIRDSLKGALAAGELKAMKEIGLAMHNFHDVFNRFPSHSTAPGHEENHDLSWRVHLLPYLGHAELYQKFHLDEAWDSEHNKKLIEEMPDTFRVEGVTEKGKTSIHLFVGDDCPLGTDEPLSIASITDGTSNTIMAVEADPETADIWTKPGGLKVTEKTAVSVVGKGKGAFKTVMCDGRVIRLRRDIDASSMWNLIRHNDGMPVSVDQFVERAAEN